MSVGITFNGTSLQNPPTIITSERRPTIKRDASRFSLARAHGVKQTGVFQREKVIELEGTIIGTSVANCDSLIDSFLQAISAEEANLDMDWNGGTRRYVCTADSPIITQPSSAGMATFNVQFVCSAGYGVDTASSTLLSSTVSTTATATNAVTVGGTFKDQTPVITVTLNSGTGLTSKSFTISNPATGVGITITRTWVAADVIVIDCANLTVKVNGSLVDYSGAFPTWAPGSGNIRSVDTLTTRNISMSATLVKKYY